MSVLRSREEIFLLHYVSSGHKVQMTAALSGYRKMKRDTDPLHRVCQVLPSEAQAGKAEARNVLLAAQQGRNDEVAL